MGPAGRPRALPPGSRSGVAARRPAFGGPTAMRGKMDCFGLTDAGRALEVNQDQFLIADLNKSMLVHQSSLTDDDHTRLFGGSQGQLLLVADGSGGDGSGKRASGLAVQTL